MRAPDDRARATSLLGIQPETKDGHVTLLRHPGRRTDGTEAAFPAHPPGKR